MKIDMFWVWVCLIMCGFMFQGYFTVEKTDWDVSYTFTNENMDFVAHGQQAVSCEGDKLPWTAINKFIAKDVADRTGTKDAVVTILGTNKRESNRYFQPFWRKSS